MIRVFVLRERRHLDALLAFLAGNWEAMSTTKHPLQVNCAPESTKRNLQQNKRYWSLLHQIQEQAWVNGQQFDAEVWHEHFKRQFIGCLDLPSGQTMAMSSTHLSTSEFAEFMTRVEAYAATELGVTFQEAA
jgi:hypothetical protein